MRHVKRKRGGSQKNTLILFHFSNLEIFYLYLYSLFIDIKNRDISFLEVYAMGWVCFYLSGGNSCMTASADGAFRVF